MYMYRLYRHDMCCKLWRSCERALDMSLARRSSTMEASKRASIVGITPCNTLQNFFRKIQALKISEQRKELERILNQSETKDTKQLT